MPLVRPCLPRRSAFTLLEMSIVLVIVGGITAAMVSMSLSTIGSVQLASTRYKLNTIEDALLAYRTANNRLPCPADPTITDAPANSATFGYETGAAGVCTDVNGQAYTTPSPPANTNIAGNTTVMEGALPVRTLGLPDEYQWDGWGRKFAYAVWTPLTAKATGVPPAGSPAGFLAYGVTQNCGAITVKNAGHANRSTAAAYVLMSYGPNGRAGASKSGHNIGHSYNFWQ